MSQLRIRRFVVDPTDRLSQALLDGLEPPSVTDILEDVPSEGWLRETPTFDVDLFESICREAADRIEADVDASAVDGWLSPRIHSVVRVRRRVASDWRFWAWLAVHHGRTYTQARWAKGRERSNVIWRYVGHDILRNAISRLWWGAELSRNGPDYGAVERVFRRVRTAQFALELRYSWYRPAVIGFARVAEPDGGPGLPDEEVKGLSVRANAYLSGAVLESIAFADAQADREDTEWYECVPSLKECIHGTPIGPRDGMISEDSIGSFESWLRASLAELRSESKPN